MNPFKAIYCSQYKELKAQGKEETAQKNGTIICSLTLVLFMLGTFLLLIAFLPGFEKDMTRFFRDIFGRSGGKTIGKLSALVLFAASFPIIKFTVGRNSSYNKTIEKFDKLSELDQKSVTKKGLIFFLSSIGVMVLSVIAVMIKT